MFFEMDVKEADMVFPEKNRRRGLRRKLKYKKHSCARGAWRYSGFMQTFKNKDAFKQQMDEYIADEERIRRIQEKINFPISIDDHDVDEEMNPYFSFLYS